ncbi:MAG: PLP-dependent aspartate aminotransferase family protein [Planctomycetota bacterium]|nr:PLP-dependent aspartate aminotransferase family protein [Planctomycetota bacterium]MDA1105297.1 PLP-dependent aspartate aminotransferase family protein [Planctomycetota bacterium]
MTSHDPLHIASRCIHGGQHPEPVTGAVMPPIFTSSTFVQQSPGVHSGFEYSRSHNATRFAFERCMASLENTGLSEEQERTCGGFAFASGLAAIATALDLLDSGDTVLVMDDVYGGTSRLLNRVRVRSAGLKVVPVNMSDNGALTAAAAQHKPKMIWTETPSNPTLKLVDLAHVAATGKACGAITVCDNTFATPILQRPLEMGVDIVMHSTTKYVGGHSDTVGGALVTGRADLAERLRFLQNAVGAVMGPFDAYLGLRGLKTLSLRMERHCQSAAHLAAWLEKQPKVDRVIYPGLASHPSHALAQRQMRLDGQPAGGGMITFFLKGGIAESRRFLESVHLFALAESLGGVESLIEHPAIMTHASVPAEQRAQLGISDSLIRVSVGIEHVGDLQADLERALTAV